MKNMVITAVRVVIVRSVQDMITMNVAAVSKLMRLRRRRSANVQSITVDINADFNGRRRTGDPRLDLAGVDNISF